MALATVGTAIAIHAGGGGANNRAPTPDPTVLGEAQLRVPAPHRPAREVEQPPGGGFGPHSVWRIDVRRARVAARSSGMITNLTSQIADRYGGNAAFNLDRYGIAFYRVPAGEPRITVGYTNCQHRRGAAARILGSGSPFHGVPIPPYAVPTVGTDHELSIYQASTDRLWDFWRASHGSNGWHACWGGRISHVSRSTGYFFHGFGMTATGLASEGGDVTLRDVQRGRIDHAMALELVSPARWDQTRWPAQRGDGNNPSPDAIPEGSRLRLPASLRLGRLHLTRIGSLVARAAQRYGFIVTDKSAVVAIQAESPTPVEQSTGRDPWTHALRGVPPYQILRNFPWQDLEVVRPGYRRTAVTQRRHE
jgi:hypothetical protein